MKNYDFDLAKKIIETFIGITEVHEVSMGMHEDWFWTAEPVWENNEYQKSFNEKIIGGIKGSTWATPVIQIDLKNGESHTFNCFVQDGLETDILEKIKQMSIWANGVLSGPINDNRLSIDIKDFNENK